MSKALPKTAEVEVRAAPQLIIEDSVEPAKVAPEPQKSETKVINGYEMTLEDY
jgi:hypothetical protein